MILLSAGAAAGVAALAPAAVLGPTPAPTGDPGGGGLCSLPLVGGVCGGIGDVAGQVADSAAKAFVDGFADGFATVVKTMLTFWVDVPTPALSGAPIAHMHGLVFWVQGVILVASLLYVAGRMMLDRSGKAAGEGLRGLVTMVVLTGAGAAGINILAVAGDHWAQWVIDESTNGNINARLGALTGGAAVLGPLGLGLEFVLSLLGILSCLGQIFFLLARVGIITVLTGTLPLSAAGASTPAGRAWLQRILAWDLAFCLYKPAAAFVYAGGFTLTGEGQGITNVLSGIMLVILAIFALPALMRLIVPMVAAASSSGGGALTGAVAGAVLASGARQISSNSGGGRGGGSGGGGTQPGLAGPGTSGGSSGGAPSGAVNTGATGSTAPDAGKAGGAAGGAAGSAGGGAAGGPVGVAAMAGAKAVSAARDGAKSVASDATGGA